MIRSSRGCCAVWVFKNTILRKEHILLIAERVLYCIFNWWRLWNKMFAFGRSPAGWFVNAGWFTTDKAVQCSEGVLNIHEVYIPTVTKYKRVGALHKLYRLSSFWLVFVSFFYDFEIMFYTRLPLSDWRHWSGNDYRLHLFYGSICIYCTSIHFLRSSQHNSTDFISKATVTRQNLIRKRYKT